VPDLFHANVNASNDPLNVAINALVERSATAELPRGYLGASAVGHECMRQTQLDWYRKPLLPARVKTIFARGHFFEARMREHLIAAGFAFAPVEALGFKALNGDLQGHADGIVIAAPAMPGAYLAAPVFGSVSVSTARISVLWRVMDSAAPFRAMRSRSGFTSFSSTN
jgi:hypothetical protein